MPKFDFNVDEHAEVSAGGSLYSIPDGWYVLKVLRMQDGVTSWGAQQVDVLWDVAEGPEAGKCTDNSWNDYAHTLHLALDGRNAGFTKHFLHMLTDSNPGFKAGEAFVHDQYAAFAGKLFGARLLNEDSSKVNTKTGKPYRDTNVKEVGLVSDARSKASAEPAAQEPAQAPEVAEDDIPF